MTKEAEFLHLQQQNADLARELKKCQADKDFVWSLWKKLQVANPDVTKAIALVLQREKEKEDIKDRRVLEILQMKDDTIDELQEILALRNKELSEFTSRGQYKDQNLDKMQSEVHNLLGRNTELEIKLQSLENRDRSKDDLHRSMSDNIHQKLHDLQLSNERLSTEVEIARAEKSDAINMRVNMENRVRTLEFELQTQVSKMESMLKEFDEAKHLLHKFETQGQQHQREVEFKNAELENVRKELSELWTSHNQLTEHSSQQADVIRQLQSLQHDTQKMLKNTEDAFSMEATSLQDMYKDLTSRYDQSKKTETSLREQNHLLRKDLLEKENIISDLQSRLDSRTSKKRSTPSNIGSSFLADEKYDFAIDYERKIKCMQQEIDLLREEMTEKDRKIDQLINDDNSDIEFDVSGLNKRERTHSTPSHDLGSTRQGRVTNRVPSRARSVSPTRQGKQSHVRFVQTERKVEDLQNLLKLKNRELAELKKSHAKRLERLKDVQTNYKLVKDQLKTLEDETYGNKKKKKPKARASAKDLRSENNNDAVWNELAHYKDENRNLIVERVNLEEELDKLRVQVSQDAATIHELQVAIEQEKENRQFDKKKAEFRAQFSSEQETELKLLKSEVQSKEMKLDRLAKDLLEIREEKANLLEERRELKNDIMNLKQAESTSRMEIADLKLLIKRLENHVEEERTKTQMQKHALLNPRTGQKPTRVRKRDPGVRSKNAKQYQRSLNKSIEKMRATFDDFAEEEGWEEVEDEIENEETESDTLGEAIASRSKTNILQGNSNDSSSSYTKSNQRRYMYGQGRKSRRPVAIQSQPGYGQMSTVSPTERNVQDSNRKTILRETASPLSPDDASRLPESSWKQRENRANQAQHMRQIRNLKQRVHNLQIQVTNLRDSRSATQKSLQTEKDTNQQLETDLHLANQRLRVSKQNIQKLSAEIEKLNKEKAHLESQMTEKEATLQQPPVDKHTESDWKLLEARLKTSSNEVCRQSASIRQLKQENSNQVEQIRNMQDKINHLERDTSQKRALLEDTRSRLKQAQENVRSDTNVVEELETKIKLLQDSVDKSKVQVDSLKRRLATATREKREYEERFLKVHNELERKTKLLLDCQTKKDELETAVTELENTAQQQLRGLASQSEAAIEAAQDKLSHAYRMIQMYQHFVKGLAHDITKGVAQTRQQVKDNLAKQQKQEANESMGHSSGNASLQKAQSLAKNILNLSQSDLEDIMSSTSAQANQDDELANDKRRDKKWQKRCEKLLQSKDDIALPLIELFTTKIEERCQLLMQMVKT